VIHLVVDRPLDGPVFRDFGQLLIDWSQPGLLWKLARHRGTEKDLYHVVPAVPAMIGTPFHSQALVTGTGGPKLTNALDGEFVR
jgi:hypothetical protein